MAPGQDRKALLAAAGSSGREKGVTNAGRHGEEGGIGGTDLREGRRKGDIYIYIYIEREREGKEG